MVAQFSDGFTHANDTSNEPKSLPASETNSNPRRADNLMGSSARCAFHLQLAMPLSRGLFYCTIALADVLSVLHAKGEGGASTRTVEVQCKALSIALTLPQQVRRCPR